MNPVAKAIDDLMITVRAHAVAQYALDEHATVRSRAAEKTAREAMERAQRVLDSALAHLRTTASGAATAPVPPVPASACGQLETDVLDAEFELVQTVLEAVKDYDATERRLVQGGAKVKHQHARGCVRCALARVFPDMRVAQPRGSEK